MRDVWVTDEREFSDGWKMRVDYWTVFGLLAAHSVRFSTLMPWASGNPRSSVRISTLVRSRTARTHRLPGGITSSSSQAGHSIWVYSRGFDSIRPVGASKETAYVHFFNRSARCRCRAAGSRYYLSRLCRRALRVRARARLGRLRATPHRLGRAPTVPGVR